MTQYQFRGKVSYNGNHYYSGEWVYGYYWTNEVGNHFIRRTIDEFENYILEDVEVIPETVSQWTGLNDKYDKKVFAKDIIQAEQFKPSYYVVKFIEGGYCANFKGQFMPMDINHFYDSKGCMFKVVGNIYDHKNLLEKYNLE